MPQIIKQETRTKILYAAEKLFMEKGYSKTKISDIMQYCNLATGTFYVYFKDKEMLLTEIYQPIVDSVESLFKLTIDPISINENEYFTILKQEILRLSEFALKFTNELHFLLHHAFDSKYHFFTTKLEEQIQTELEKYLTIGLSRGFIRNTHIPILSKICCGIIVTTLHLLTDSLHENEHIRGIIVQETIDLLVNAIKKH